MGGIPILFDVNSGKSRKLADQISKHFNVQSFGLTVDITKPDAIKDSLNIVLDKCSKVDILINNAAVDPKVKNSNSSGKSWIRFENYPMEV